MKELKTGIKYDQDKIRWDLLPWDEVEEIVKVLMHGARKYEAYNWQKVVSENKDRYFSALIRHIKAWKTGEEKDKESNLSHLSHAGCCLLFLMWNDNQSKNDTRRK